MPILFFACRFLYCHMKLTLALLLLCSTAFAAVPSKPLPKPYALQFSQLTAHDLGELRGKKLTKLETFMFNSARKQMQKIAEDEEPNPNRFNAVGFVLGLLFPWGLIASYFFKDRSVRRSAWIGTGVIFLVALILLLSYGSKM